MKGNNLILASGSPRRAKILAAHGVAFSVLKTDAEEVAIVPGTPYPADATRAIVERNARLKLAAAATELAKQGMVHCGVLAADTVVWFRDRILGKPRDLAEARRFLSEMSGQVHVVFTGVACLPAGRDLDRDGPLFRIAESRVRFRKLSDAMIADYVARVKPLDRAGAYDIDESGDLIVESFDGEYENVMGLPLAPLREWGIVV